MKNPFKSDQKSVTRSADKSPQKADSNKDVQAFLSRVSAMPKSAGDARLVFALDATASRQQTWDSASQLQASMFSEAQSLGGLNVQLCYFRGFAEFFHSDWQTDPDRLLALMQGIYCQAGATQIERLLRHAIAEASINKIKAVVYIGDAMEENIDILAQLAGKLGLLNVPLFMFQERNDAHVRQAFMEMCRLSGGAFSQFDSGSADQLRELLKAVAVYAAGGLKALKDFSKTSHRNVKLLEQQLKDPLNS